MLQIKVTNFYKVYEINNVTGHTFACLFIAIKYS